MKPISLALVDTTAISTILPKVFRRDFVEAGRPILIGRQLLQESRDLVGRAGRSIFVPKIGTMSAARVSEGAEVTSFASGSYSTTEVTPFKIGIGLKFTEESLNGAELDVMNSQIREAGWALATLENEEIFFEVSGRQPASPTANFAQTITATTTQVLFTYATTPILEVVAVLSAGVTKTRITDYKVDYQDSKIEFVTAPGSAVTVELKYFSTTRTKKVFASTVGTLSYEDLLAARTISFKKPSYRRADVAVVHSEGLEDLLTDNRFIDSSRYGSSTPILNGEVARAAGLRIIESNSHSDSFALVMDRGTSGWMVHKREVDVKRLDLPQFDSLAVFFYQEFAPKIVNDESVVVLLNIAPDSKNL